MANHADLLESEWHPAYPPGITTSVVGDVYVADGTGTGAWTSLDSLLEADKAYGEITTVDKTIVVPEAIDSSLNTDADYITLTSLDMWTNAGSLSVVVDAVAGTLTFSKAGNYLLNAWIDHSINGVSNENIAFKFSLDNILDSKKLISTSDFAGDIRNSSASGLVLNVTAGQVVKMHVACTAARTLTLHAGQFNVVRL